MTDVARSPVLGLMWSAVVAIALLALLSANVAHAQTPGVGPGAPATTAAPTGTSETSGTAVETTTPSPASTGMGDGERSGATNPVAILLGAMALAVIVGAGGRYAMRRRPRT